MKFTKENTISINDFDSKIKTLWYCIGVLAALGLMGLSIKIAVTNQGGFDEFLKSIGAFIGAMASFAGCALIGNKFYSSLPPTLSFKTPLSKQIIVRQEKDKIALYYKRWGEYRLWKSEFLGNLLWKCEESSEDPVKGLNEVIARYKNDYRLAYMSRHKKPPKVDANRILYEGKL